MILKMKLRSDAIPGSGEGLAGIIDADISYDEFGLPYIPAKRIKGILRESAQDLEDVNAVKQVLQCSTIEIFGSRGKKHGTKLKISDGYIEHYAEIRRFLQACFSDKELKPIFNREAVLAYYTYTRSQTTINEYGTAKEGSLRTFRVLRKGEDIAFYFEVECPDEWKDNLRTICQVTRNFGSSRTRGFGEITLTLHESTTSSADQEKKEQAETFQDEECCRLRLTIQNHAQLLANVQVGKDQFTEPYIPGSFILGAFAQAYIHHFKKDATHEEFRKIFLDGDVTFSNAYPVYDPAKDAYYPTPLSVVKEKDKEHYLDLAYEKDFTELIHQKMQTKGTMGDFVQFTGTKTLTMSTATEIEYHHARPPQNRALGHAAKNKGEFFQFAVLQAHQEFISEISGKYKYLKPLQELLKTSNTCYLGRSKTAQYGKCMVKGTLSKIPTASKREWKNGEDAVFTLASEMVLGNEHGFMTPDPRIFRDEIAEISGIRETTQLKIEHTFLQFKQIGGFLSIWHMPKAQVPALAAGSVVICKNKTGKDLDISGLARHSFGLRAEEGFGKIHINWHGQQKLNPPSSNAVNYTLPDNVEAARDLICLILDNRMKEMVRAEAVRQSEAFKRTYEKLTNTFIGKMLLFLNTAEDFTALHECLKFRERARKQLEKVRKCLFLEMDDRAFQVQEDKFREFLEKEKDSAQVSRLRDVLTRAGIEQKFTGNDIQKEVFTYYQIYAIHFFNLLKLHNRGEKKRGSN